MKITGAAPKIAIPTFIFMLITVVIDYLTSPLFKITMNNYSALIIAGIIMIITGALMVLSTGKKLLKSFNSEKLMTDGLYRVFRNPMYASYLIFVIPGICLLFNSWLVLTTVILNYILLKIFIKEEHQFLVEKFGEEYKNYLEKVWIKFL